MAKLFSKEPELTPAEIKEIRNARKSYGDFLSTQQQNINADVKKKNLTPETGSRLLTIIKKSQDWLKNNPNANFNEITTSRADTETQLNDERQLNFYRLIIGNAIAAAPLVLNEALKKKIIDAKMDKQFRALLKEGETWYNKNKDKATPVDFSEYGLDFGDKFKAITTDQNVINFLSQEANKYLFSDSRDTKKALAKRQQEMKRQEDSQVDIERGVNTILATGINTFFGFLLIAFLIMCGSFAANMAISRPPAYRVLYFIWGFLPIFAPFVLLYTIVRRVREGRLPMYAILPLSIDPATTRFGKFLWYPFYWVPDADSTTVYREFQNSLVQNSTV